VICAHNGSFSLQTTLNTGATGLRDAKPTPIAESDLRLPTAATADY
jgi:hypothetical protein